jgi:hypothetical protein
MCHDYRPTRVRVRADCARVALDCAARTVLTVWSRVTGHCALLLLPGRPGGAGTGGTTGTARTGRQTGECTFQSSVIGRITYVYDV